MIHVNWKRGFIRLWFVISVPWVVAIAIFSFYLNDAYKHFYAKIEPTTLSANDLEIIDFTESTLTIGHGSMKTVITWEIPDPINKHQDKHHEVLKQVIDFINNKAMDKNHKTKSTRKQIILGLGTAILFPLFLLIIGMILRWLVLGFWPKNE